MNKKLSEYEELLVELVHYVSSTVNNEKGLPAKELKSFLTRPIPHKNGKNCLECLDLEGRAFLNELIVFMNELED